MDSLPNKKKLYALLVGINDYQEQVQLGTNSVYFPKLYGPTGDVKKMMTYLSADTYYAPDIKILMNSEATKSAIVEAFNNHLGMAGEEDVAFFYFSGHGAQEFTDKIVFSSETDGKLETIVCYYDEAEKSNFMLADKELRWLIHDLSEKKAHVITVFDCCHSGDNTRNGLLLNHSFSGIIEKRIKYVFPERNWDQFIFAKTIKKEDCISIGINKVIPEGRHIQFSACESNESAVEINSEGVFTRVLLNVLTRSGSDISYQSLGSRIRQYMRGVYDQKPTIYMVGTDANDIYLPFLNKPFSAAKNTFGELTYNSSKEWQLNMGAIHGIGKNKPVLQIIEPGTNKIIKGTIGSVNVDYSEVIPSEALDETKVYFVKTESLKTNVIRLHSNTNAADLTDQEAIFKELFAGNVQNIIAEQNETDSQYVLQFLNGRYYVTYPNDPFRPLFSPITIAEKDLPVKISSCLKHICEWEALRQLTNEDESTRLNSKTLTIEVSLNDAPYQPIDNDATLDIQYKLLNNTWENKLKVRLTNMAAQTIYVCCLHLSSNFGCSTGFLNPDVYTLEQDNSVELTFNGNNFIPVQLNDVVKLYNWKEEHETLKFILSTENFDASLLSKNGLRPPALPGRQRNNFEMEKGLPTIVDPAKVKGWLTKEIKLIFHNPLYNIINPEDLAAMMDDENTADFALQLYFEPQTESLSPEYVMRKDIQVTREKGLIQDKIIDIANLIARTKRNLFYKNNLARFPNRLKIVSEGDSWFQHPLLLDIIDHLHRVFNIYCVAAAGDTLRNYFSEEKKQGEYFLDAIENNKPAIFLISGGGNDILGSRFRNFLADNPDQSQPEGQNAARFMTNEFLDEIKSLMDIYRTGFELLAKRFPEMKCIVHGYDYPVKVDEANKWWLGRYMIEKGIARHGDRIALIHYIMDVFNQQLKNTCEEFKKTVTYLDVRGIVRYNPAEKVDQWYDEIHPTNDGFQQIAMKFIQTIDAM